MEAKGSRLLVHPISGSISLRSRGSNSSTHLGGRRAKADCIADGAGW
jgi:hypothetical protein